MPKRAWPARPGGPPGGTPFESLIRAGEDDAECPSFGRGSGKKLEIPIASPIRGWDEDTFGPALPARVPAPTRSSNQFRAADVRAAGDRGALGAGFPAASLRDPF